MRCNGWHHDTVYGSIESRPAQHMESQVEKAHKYRLATCYKALYYNETA